MEWLERVTKEHDDLAAQRRLLGDYIKKDMPGASLTQRYLLPIQHEAQGTLLAVLAARITMEG